MKIILTAPQRLIAKIYLSAICIFTFFRLLFLISELNKAQNSSISDIFLAFVMGLRFDIVISGYILIIPYFILSVSAFFNIKFELLSRLFFYYIFLLFSITFMVCSIDIPYYNQFFSRLSVSALEWIDSPWFIFKMIIEEPRCWLFVIPFIITNILFFKLLKRWLYIPFPEIQARNIVLAVSSLIFLGLIIIGIRGRIDEKSPIRVGTAYFSNNAFVNQMGLNPNFTFIRSYLDSKNPRNKYVHLMDDSLALQNVSKYLNIKDISAKYPLLRNVTFDSIQSPNKFNVVIILMESMSAMRMQRHGNTEKLTPFLDSISNEGYYFENAYTSGIHTFNGIYSTLVSMPALYRQHPLKETSMKKYSGIYTTLKKNGYSTIFFNTHDGQFDNSEGFLKANDCEEVITKPDYPSEKVMTTLGVPDDFMFEFSIPVLNKLANKNKPFVAAFLTSSNHKPYYIPEYFRPKSNDITKQIVEYSDFSLRKFIEMASLQPWFSNTLFVFVADHGAALDATYDLAIGYNHAPLIFYAPQIIKEKKVFDCMAGQIDIFPTIMGFLKIPYVNNTLGINLLKEKRQYAFFNVDDKFGVIDSEWLLIAKTDNSKRLYRYRQNDKTNYSDQFREKTEEMLNYAQSNLQACQHVIRTNKQ